MKCRNYAHRGFSGKYPENTLLAFEKALEVGCEGIEFDVQMTIDNEIVIIHDETIDRTSNKTGFVKNMTYEELCEADFSYKYTKEFGFQKIPTLREYFELVKEHDIISNIELKTGIFEYIGIEKAVYDLVRLYNMKDKVIISSFNHYSIMRMKEIAPELSYAFLSETWILNPEEYLNKYNIQVYHPQFNMLTDDIIKELKVHNCKINTWTVNKEEDIDKMIQLEVDGIISNYPDLTSQKLVDFGLRKKNNSI